MKPDSNTITKEEEERSSSAPIDCKKPQRELDRLSNAAFFSTANINQQWDSLYHLEKLKKLLKNAPKYFEETEHVSYNKNVSNSENGQCESYAVDCNNLESYKSPFALLAQSLDDSQDRGDGNFSINELVVKEYANERGEIENQDEAHQSSSMKILKSFQSRSKNDAMDMKEPFFKSLIGMPLAKTSSVGGLDVVDRKAGKISASLEDLKNDFRSTLKTLALILMYLLISLPTYITAAIHRNCYCAAPNGLQNCLKLREFNNVFDNISLIGHIVFPCTWLFFDKMYSDKLLKTLRLVRDTR